MHQPEKCKKESVTVPPPSLVGGVLEEKPRKRYTKKL
jgi:hypothetical protein